MQVEVGAVVEGTVTGITKFGAFVSLPDGKSGLVHISEIANTYVSDVNEFLKLGDKVTLHTDGLQVTATTASGVAEVVGMDGTAAGDRVRVRFPAVVNITQSGGGG